MICDFCSEPDPQHRILCRSFAVDDTMPHDRPMESIGDFLACDHCHRLINANEREKLIARARAVFKAHYGYWNSDTEKQLRRFYEQFWAARLTS